MDDVEKRNEKDLDGMDGILTETLKKLFGFMRKELIFRGILFLLLGLLMMFKPGPTLLAVTVTIGVFVLLDGLAMLISALSYHGRGKALLVLHAALFILLGVFTCTAPLKMNVIWIVMIGFWQLLSGIHCLGLQCPERGSAVFSGICGIVAGLFLIFMPILGSLTLTWVMGLISFLNGCAAIGLGIRLKNALK